MSKHFAIRVTWHDGEEEFLKYGTTEIPVLYTSRNQAWGQKEFMMQGMAEDVQSINVVCYPLTGRRKTMILPLIKRLQEGRAALQLKRCKNPDKFYDAN